MAAFLIAAACIAPVAFAGMACDAIVEKNHMQEIAYSNTARRQRRWAHL